MIETAFFLVLNVIQECALIFLERSSYKILNSLPGKKEADDFDLEFDEFGAALGGANGIAGAKGKKGGGANAKGAANKKQQQSNGKYEQIGYGFSPFEGTGKESRGEEINYDWVTVFGDILRD